MSRKNSTDKNDQGKAEVGEAEKISKKAMDSTSAKASKTTASKASRSKTGAKIKAATNRKTPARSTASQIQAETQTRTTTPNGDQVKADKTTAQTTAQTTDTDTDMAPVSSHQPVSSDNPVSPHENGASKSGRGLAGLALLCSLLALAAGGYAAYQTSISQQVTGSQASGFDDRLKLLVSDQQSLKSNFDGLSTRADQRDSTMDSQSKKFVTDLSSAQASIEALQGVSEQSIQEIKSDLGSSVARWQLVELQSLLGRVNQYYLLTGNKIQTLAGLRLAQAKLTTISNPSMRPVGVSLAEDVVLLESADNIDIEALNNRLLGVGVLIPKLKFTQDKSVAATKTSHLTEAAKPDAEASGSGGILSIGKSLLGDIGSLVKYKNLEAPLRPSLDDGTRFVLYESLQLKLQAATLAMLRHNNPVYQSQLALVGETLQSHFDLEETSAKTILSELEIMRAQDVSLNVQEISKGLTALNKVLEN